MRLLTTNQIHCLSCRGMHYNASDAIITWDYLSRYTEYCDEVTVLVRSREVESVDPALPRIDGPGVRIQALPDPLSPWAAILSLPTFVRRIRQALRLADAYTLKLPDALATLVGLILWMTRRPYAVEVVADCRQGILLAKGHLPWVRFYAGFFDALTRFLVKRASSASYVSDYLRRRYPLPSPERQWCFSSLELTPDLMGSCRGLEFFSGRPIKLIATGRQSPEKGHLTLIQAFREIVAQAERPVELHLLGDGPERLRLQRQADDLGIHDQVFFWGKIPRGPELLSHLDGAHLYVLPSLTEGMGRGLIEAMGRGLPCVASAVGGVPEYLDSPWLVPPADPLALAHKVLAVIREPSTLARMSRENFDRAQAFTPQRIKAKKDAFWSAVLTPRAGAPRSPHPPTGRHPLVSCE